MPPKAKSKNPAATDLEQLLRDFTDAIKASQEALATAYDNVAGGYQRHESKLLKTRPRVPFAQWITQNIDASVFLRVLEAKFGSEWDSLKKPEQTRRLQAVKALQLHHPFELFLWFGSAAVKSREAWLGLDRLAVTAPTLFSEVLAVRANKRRRPPHYLANLFTPSEVIEARKQFAARAQQKSQEAEQPVGGSEVTDSDTQHTETNQSRKSIAPTSDDESGSRDSNNHKTQADTSGRNQSRETHGAGTSSSSPQSDDDSRQRKNDANADLSRARDQNDEDDLNRSSPPLFDDQPPSKTAMRGTADTRSGVGMGTTVRMRSRTGATTTEDSGIGMDDFLDEEMENEVDNPDKSSDRRDEIDTEASQQKGKAAETEPAADVATLEKIFEEGLEQVIQAKVYIARQEDDENTAIEDSAALKSKMIDFQERIVARAAELLRAAEGSEEDWEHSRGQLTAGDWEKDLVEAGCKKRKRTEDAAASRAKRTKAESCVQKIALQVREASQTFEELRNICEKD